jgi:hypothetical protein
MVNYTNTTKQPDSLIPPNLLTRWIIYIPFRQLQTNQSPKQVCREKKNRHPSIQPTKLPPLRARRKEGSREIPNLTKRRSAGERHASQPLPAVPVPTSHSRPVPYSPQRGGRLPEPIPHNPRTVYYNTSAALSLHAYRSLACKPGL